jgi:hypothetical protein
MRVFAMDVPKYMDDLRMLKDRYTHEIHNPDYAAFGKRHLEQYIESGGIIWGGNYTNDNPT